MANAIETEGLSRSFGETVALDRVDLEVPEGTVLGLLGPNGAGKTTAVRILATLLAPDRGTARVAGHDVVNEPAAVRASIGLSGQYAAIDDYLTGRENLIMIGELSQLSRRDARKRADELLEEFDLLDAADRQAGGYSGGMRRRIDLAGALVARPPILFLDEPTTGLDPRSRRGMWDVIRELVAEGATLLLTTQYLDEADELADRIAVIDRGRLIAEGSAAELKANVGGDLLELRPADPDEVERAAEALRGDGSRDGEVEIVGEGAERRIELAVGEDAEAAADAIRRLGEAGVTLADINLHRPSLDQVFFALTDEAEREMDEEAAEAAAGSGGEGER